jgi:hypothetical protein
MKAAVLVKRENWNPLIINYGRRLTRINLKAIIDKDANACFEWEFKTFKKVKLGGNFSSSWM